MAGPINVPQSYVPLLQEGVAATGIPYNVEAAQAFVESSFNAQAVSSAGAEGWLQFLPSTYDTYAAQAGVQPGTEFNPADEEKVYDSFMSSLLATYHGDVRNALAAYNAGTASSPAGQQYASEILALAGSGDVTVPGGTTPTGTPTPSVLTSASGGPFPGGEFDPFNWVWSIFGGAAKAGTQGIQDLINATFSFLGGIVKKSWADAWAHYKPDLIRIGLILLGVIVIYAGIQGFLRPNAEPSQIVVQSAKQGAEKVRARGQ
jgi:hypothetical protein